MDGQSHRSGWELAALEEAVGEPITVHVLTAHPLYRPRAAPRIVFAWRPRGDEWGTRAQRPTSALGIAGRGRHLVTTRGTAEELSFLGCPK